MAKLPQAGGGTGLQIRDLAPAGQHIAVCLRINDMFGVERPSFNDPKVKELVDVTRFLFGLVGQDGKPYLCQTYEFNISGAPGANLMKFLTAWLGTAPAVGWDYVELLNKGAMLTLQHKLPRKPGGTPYASITGISPVHPQLVASIPNPSIFAGLIASLEQEGSRPAASAPMTPPAPGPTRSYPSAPPPPPAPPAPPAPPPVAPPPPPPPPPPPAGPAFYVAVNGQAVKISGAELGKYSADTPCIREGETAWQTVGAYNAPPPAAPGNVPPAPDDDVPF